jgi:hypothetical protein
MEILLTADAIVERVQYVLEAPEGERYAIVAFIGARPLTWIKKPKDLHIYCWPSAGGTHPDGVDSLVKKGANVAFVEHLHSKVYHSERGTVVGSANLSSNAFDGMLTETAVYLPPGAFPIEEQLDRLTRGLCAPRTDEFARRLAKLRIDHNAYLQRNPAERRQDDNSSDINAIVEIDSGQVQSFADWYHGPNRAQWQLGVSLTSATLPKDVEHEEINFSGKEPETWIGVEREDKFVLSMPTLECQFFQKAYRIRKDGIDWWFPNVVRKTELEDWAEMPYIFTAQDRIPAGSSVPFDLDDPKFQPALSKAVEELGEESEQMIGPITDEFVDTLARHYFAQV